MEKKLNALNNMVEKAKKHMCYNCFNDQTWSDEEMTDVHVDIPTEELPGAAASGISDQLVEEIFPKMWNNNKAELKIMSKKELGKELFGAGAYVGINVFIKMINKDEKEQNKEK